MELAGGGSGFREGVRVPLPWSHSRRPVTRPELSTRSIVKVKKARTAVPVRVYPVQRPSKLDRYRDRYGKYIVTAVV